MPDGQAVRLDLYTFHTEDGYDPVRLYDGCTENDTLIGSYSGHNIPTPIISTGTVLLISFTSDSHRTRQGFSATASGAGNC